MDDTTKKIIRDLAKHRPRNTIITELCEYSSLPWEDAELLVSRIENEYAWEINTRQKPFFILLGSTIALSGLLLSVYMVFASLKGLMILSFRLPIPYLGNAIFFTLRILALIGGTSGVLRIIRG
jgi:hypothetical protein